MPGRTPRSWSRGTSARCSPGADAIRYANRPDQSKHGRSPPPDRKGRPITSTPAVPDSKLVGLFASVRYIAIVGTVATASTAAVCLVLHHVLLCTSLALTCCQQVSLQIKLHRLQNTVLALAVAQVPPQRRPSE
ncbi:hypothetical protein HUT16_17350 [Kitasatospora sp. NA04385]|uniref:hypothetical protein n=1 Tax=Kitasatospora sp. NA04385 TaxID=2742135 RepID=UPI001590252A|nr:hypothetical protein [Kitasatospora sp. NA04385]QKW20599.1 hypothetical protein HUT16_17350 [Kitasatospora sp. NA04385]